MTCKSVAQRLTRHCGACLTLLLAVAILVPGCAGKRSELFSSLITPKAAVTDADSDLAEEPQPEDANRIADAAEARSETQLSAFSDSEIIDGPPGMMQRLRKRFGRHEEAVVTTDPFIESEAPKAKAKPEPKPAQAPIAEKVDPSVEELLASFESKMPERKPSAIDPWWKNEKSSTPSDDVAKIGETREYAEEFDSRLDRLRAQLASSETESTQTKSRSTGDSFNPFAAEAAEVAKVETLEAEETVPDNKLLTRPADELHRTASVEPQHPLTGDTSWAETPSTEAPLGDAKPRIKAMLADARRDWENWNLRRAYRTALDAQELAVLENVQFLDNEEQPQQLANEIAADLRGDAVQTASAKVPEAGDAVNPFADVGEQVAIAPQTDLGFPEFQDTADLWSTSPSKSAKQADAMEICDATMSSRSPTSGVSLLPPNDDFPSDAAGSDWAPSLSSMSPTPKSAETEDIQLTTHKSPGFTLSRDSKPRDQLPGLSSKDNQALLTTVADQRNRVFEPKPDEWPSLSSPRREAEHKTASREPIRIAKAPRFSLDEVPADLPVASTPSARKSGSKGSLLGQFWRSQPIWLIGGILLLIIALRLLPWPRRETE